MQRFQTVALTPAGLLDPSIAIAASRAGGLGVLNLECRRTLDMVDAAITRLVRYTDAPVGLQIPSWDQILFDHVLADLPKTVRLIILSTSANTLSPQLIHRVHQQQCSAWIQVNDAQQAQLAEQWGADGLIAKGHEAGGWVSEETSFILLQRLLNTVHLPIWVQGGIGLHTAAACAVAGAAGVVLDAQLALTRESQLPKPVQMAIAAMDGSETICLGAELGQPFRVYSQANFPAIRQLRDICSDLAQAAPPDVAQIWRQAVEAQLGWGAPEKQVWPIGQDAAFAGPLAQSHTSVAGVIHALREAVDSHAQAAYRLKTLDVDAPLAQSHGTRYPIVQGPMTRVSDRAEFALQVAQAGGLPFLALALMRAPEVAALLRETRELLGARPWGVGILGFVPPELRQEQMEVIRQYRPPFAVIAGGRPDQARALELDGIHTYLHVPSPGLLRLFLRDGARRFIFEGRECGGHVGPRSSFVLWNTMVDVLLEELPAGQAEAYHVLLAAGIHDARSGAMVATLAAPLAERGVRVGALMGTAYLFTREAISTGAILSGFQEEALRCQRTVLIETGPGHATRCAETPYRELFESEKRRLLSEGHSPDEMREALEALNLGRLRIASKGVARNPHLGQSAAVSRYIAVSEEEQHSQGMYMIGQVAALRDSVCSIEDLHHALAAGSAQWLATHAASAERPGDPAGQGQPSDIAIVGMACLLPKAPDLLTYWEHILTKVDAIREIPKERWDWERYYDPDRKARDKIYSHWGGFLDEIAFDPTTYGIPPNALRSIEPLQLLALETVRAALQDAGYLDRPFPRERTSVILGAGGGAGDLGEQYAVRASLPELLEDVPEELLAQLPEWTEDSFPGILLNVIAGRIANRFDLGGLNYTVDAACASSLAAIYLAVRELETGTSDLVITGGVDNVQNPFGYLCFSKTQALSPQGHCRTFDDSADGIAISEGLAIVVLKRLADAERDGDRIYAVIKSVAGSSDGRDKSLTAPRPEGQVRALERAYAKAGISPASVSLIEAHGTGTVVGDKTEVETLKRVFSAAGATLQSCAIGSVKSMIGHTKCAAGVAGMIKVALSLYHKVLPPTLGVEKPNAKASFATSPFYVNSETRPWINAAEHPRRAGVSAFGFGGTNFHAVLEEYAGDFLPRQAASQHWAYELCLWSANSRHDLGVALDALAQALANGAQPELPQLAYALYEAFSAQPATASIRLAIVSTSLEDLQQKLAQARSVVHSPGPAQIQDPRGIYLTDAPLAPQGRVAFLFPGQGSQYPDMLRDLAVIFSEVRETFERADCVLQDRLSQQPLSRSVFPPPTFNSADAQAQHEQLTRTDVAQPALGAADMALVHLLAALGVSADMLAGQSYGEYVALCVAGAIDETTLIALSEARGRCIIEAAQDDLGTMAAVRADASAIAPVLETIKGVWIANLNAPTQTIISGTHAGVATAVERLRAQGMTAQPVTVACAFHSPLVAPAQQRLAQILAQITFAAPSIEVYSNTNAAPYPHAPAAIAALLAEHLVRPVRFSEEIEAMYVAGARIFVEVGPRNILASLTQQILGQRPHLAINLDQPGRPGIAQLQHALGQLAVHGVPVQLDRLFQGRIPQQAGSARRSGLNLADLVEETAEKPLPPTTWFVDGGRARPMNEPKAAPHHPVKLALAQNGASAGMPAPVNIPPLSTKPVTPTGYSQIAGAAHAAPGVAEQAPQAAPADAESEQVMLQFQGLMGRFLETQHSVMRTFLQETQPAAPPQAAPGPLPTAPADAAPRSLEQTNSPSYAAASAHNGILPTASQDHRMAIHDRLTPASEQVSPIHPASHTVPEHHETTRDGAVAPISRYVLRAVERPLSGAPRGLAPGRAVVITDDGAGLAQAIKAQLERQGHPVALLQSTDGRAGSETGVYQVDLMSAVEIERAVGRVRQAHGPVAALIHLLPLRPHARFEQLDLATWRDRLALEARSLFLLAKALRQDLETASSAGGAALIGASSMGGVFASDSSFDPTGDPARADRTPGIDGSLPTQGAIAGFLKSLAREWPGVFVRAVDLDPRDGSAVWAQSLLAELGTDDAQIEVGYCAGRRFILEPALSPLPDNSVPAIDSDSVVLLTGGARGITFDIALELALRYHPTLILIGRSPLPVPEEPSDTAELTTPHDLKAALIARQHATGQPVTPAQVEQAYQRLLNEREVRRNLAALHQLGVQAHYYSADVRDEPEFGALIERIYESFGRIDAAIHGAGIIEDKLVRDKAVESFDRVLSTKVDSAFILSRRLRPESLRMLVFFSSVSGRFGNRGQADYAAANEVLNKLAIYLDRRWPARVVSINWGPWARGGMVSPELQQEFTRRGVALIPPEVGRRKLDEELRSGRKGNAEVIIAGAALGLDAAAERAIPTAPLLAGLELTRRPDGVEVVRTLDPARDVYLHDHQLDGKPVFPFAMALELMAELVQQAWPDHQLVGLRDMQVLKGIVLNQEQQMVRVSARTQPETRDEHISLQVEISNAASGQRYYCASVDLARRSPEPPFHAPMASDLRPFPMSVAEAYDRWLFHGTLFEGIATIGGIADQGITATLSPSNPARCLAGGRGSWLIDPIVFDSGLQLAILWARAYLDATPLPARFQRYQRFGSLSDAPVRCYLQVTSRPHERLFYIDIFFVGDDGRLLGLLEGMECPCSKALNRLAEAPAPA